MQLQRCRHRAAPAAGGGTGAGPRALGAGDSALAAPRSAGLPNQPVVSRKGPGLAAWASPSLALAGTRLDAALFSNGVFSRFDICFGFCFDLEF